MENIEVRGNVLKFKGKEYPCAIGKGGIREDKKEGDGATPAGCFPIRKVFYRADKVSEVTSPFETQVLAQDDGWSDDVNQETYNTYIKLPVDYSHENLWREDDVYDIIVTLGYNDAPPVAGKGSAIFMHVAREGYTPTAGCIALSESDLREVLALCEAGTQVCVSA